MHFRRFRGRGELFAEGLVAEHLRELGQQLQMGLGRLLGDEQHEHLGDRLAVGRVEGDRSRTQARGSFSHKFNNKGTFAYRCTIHAGMVGTIRVR